MAGLNDYRAEIDRIDDELVALFARRMDICAEIARYKRAHGLPVRDDAREREKLRAIGEKLPGELRAYGVSLYERIFELSRERQENLPEPGMKE